MNKQTNITLKICSLQLCYTKNPVKDEKNHKLTCGGHGCTAEMYKSSVSSKIEQVAGL